LESEQHDHRPLCMDSVVNRTRLLLGTAAEADALRPAMTNVFVRSANERPPTASPARQRARRRRAYALDRIDSSRCTSDPHHRRQDTDRRGLVASGRSDADNGAPQVVSLCNEAQDFPSPLRATARVSSSGGAATTLAPLRKTRMRS
jgi:hypothetical protein